MNIEKLHKKLIKKNITLSAAESCTGGLLSSKFTRLSGSSKYFQMGLVTYSNNAKIKILKVKKKIIDKYGSVSPECCGSMVQGLTKISKSKINISITGIAGPNGGTKNKPVGLVYMGIKKGKKLSVTKYMFGKKQRNIIQNSTVNKTLRLINNLVDELVFDEIKEWINENIKDDSKLKVFATGGNINKIQDMTRTKSGKPISYLSIKNLYNNLLEKDITNRMIKYNLNPDRADVIIPALKIFISTMDWANTNKLFVPKVGLVDGMIKEIHNSMNSVN